MYDKNDYICSRQNLLTYGLILLSHSLDPEKQTGQNPNSLHGWPWQPVLRRQPIYGVDGRLGQQAADGQEPLHLYRRFHRATGTRADQESLRTAQPHPRRDCQGSRARNDEDTAGEDHLQLPPPAQPHHRPPCPQPRIAQRLHCPLHARNGGGHPAEHPQTPIRPLDHQELQGIRRTVRRVLQSPAQAVRLCRHRPEVLRRLRRLVHRQELLRQYDRPPRQGAEDHHACGPRRGSARQRGDREPQVPRADGRCREHLSDGVGDPGHRHARPLEKPTQGCCPRHLPGGVLHGAALQRLLDHQRR